MEALSFPQTRWSFSPKICAANWAAASGERMVEQPRPARGKEAQSQPCMLNLIKTYIGGRGGGAELTAWHTQGRPDVLGTPVWGERRAVDDGIRRVSGHDWPEAVTSAGHRHKNSGHAVT